MSVACADIKTHTNPSYITCPPKDALYAPQNAPLRLPRGPTRTNTPQDACKTHEDIPNKSRFPSLASQVSSAAPKNVKHILVFRRCWAFGLLKKRKQGGGPQNRPQEASKTLFGPQKWPQETPRRPRRGPKTPPRRLQDAPKTPPRGPKRPPGAPKRPPRGFPDPPDRSQAPSASRFLMQKCPKH